jgi:hypothetical protein
MGELASPPLTTTPRMDIAAASRIPPSSRLASRRTPAAPVDATIDDIMSDPRLKSEQDHVTSAPTVRLAASYLTRGSPHRRRQRCHTNIQAPWAIWAPYRSTRSAQQLPPGAGKLVTLLTPSRAFSRLCQCPDRLHYVQRRAHHPARRLSIGHTDFIVQISKAVTTAADTKITTIVKDSDARTTCAPRAFVRIVSFGNRQEKEEAAMAGSPVKRRRRPRMRRRTRRRSLAKNKGLALIILVPMFLVPSDIEKDDSRANAFFDSIMSDEQGYFITKPNRYLCGIGKLVRDLKPSGSNSP